MPDQPVPPGGPPDPPDTSDTDDYTYDAQLATTTPKYPGIMVRLTGRDSAVEVTRACVAVMRAAGLSRDEVARFTEDAAGCEGYEELLRIVMNWFEVR